MFAHQPAATVSLFRKSFNIFEVTHQGEMFVTSANSRDEALNRIFDEAKRFGLDVKVEHNSPLRINITASDENSGELHFLVIRPLVQVDFEF